MFANADMTIYNRIPQQGTGKEIYKRTQIEGVFWNESTEVVSGENGLKRQDIAKVLIPIESLQQIKNKQYEESEKWLKNANKDAYYTFNNGDTIIKGLIEDEITSPKELKEKYNNVLQVVSIKDNRYGSEDMHHFSIKAK